MNGDKAKYIATAISAGVSKLIAERKALGKHREAEHIFKLTKNIFIIPIISLGERNYELDAKYFTA